MPLLHIRIDWKNDEELERLQAEIEEADRRERLRKSFHLTAADRSPKQEARTANA